MEGPAVANAQAQGSDLRAADINARCIGLGHRLDVVPGQQIDQTPLDAADQLTHADAEPTYVQQQVADQLTRPVIGDLTAAVHLHHRNFARKQQMLGLAGLALREYGRMLQQPDLVATVGITRIGEMLHGLPGSPILDQP